MSVPKESIPKEKQENENVLFQRCVNAIENGDFSVVLRCLNQGLDIDLKNDMTRWYPTLLQKAVNFMRSDMIELLIMRGADIEAYQPISREFFQKPPLQVALNSGGDPEVLKLLIRQKADLSSPNILFQAMRCTTATVKLMLDAKVSPRNPVIIDEGTDKGIWTPLQYSRYLRSYDVEELLLAHGAEAVETEDTKKKKTQPS